MAEEEAGEGTYAKVALKKISRINFVSGQKYEFSNSVL